MRLTSLSLALAMLAYTPTNAQIAAAQPAVALPGGLGAIGAIVSDIGAIAGGLNGGGATVTVPVTVTAPGQQRPGNGNAPLPTTPPGQGQQQPPARTQPGQMQPGQQQPPLASPLPGQPGGENQRQPSPLPSPGVGGGGGNQRQNPSPVPGQNLPGQPQTPGGGANPTPRPLPGQNQGGGANPTPRPLPDQNFPGQNPTPTPGMGGLPGQAMGTGRLGAGFPLFTGPARISTMIQRVQSVESVAATATGEEQMALMASASTMRDAAEKAVASTTMGSGAMDMEAGMQMGGAGQLKGPGILAGLVVGWLGVGMLLL